MKKKIASILFLIMVLIMSISFLACEESDPGIDYDPTAGEEPMLEIVYWGWTREYGYIIAEGEIRNISDRKLDNVMVKLRYYDDEQDFVKSEIDVVEPESLMPGDIASFEVYTVDDRKITDSRIYFQYPFGDYIAAVYHQGE